MYDVLRIQNFGRWYDILHFANLSQSAHTILKTLRIHRFYQSNILGVSCT